MIVTKRAYARVGFVGNPSDGYNGKTIAFTIGDYYSEVVLYESPELELRPGPQDDAVFASLDDLVQNVGQTGYYGGVRLLKAAAKKFAQYCYQHGIKLAPRNFTVRYDTNIPRQVGLGGSSAIITLDGFRPIDSGDGNDMSFLSTLMEELQGTIKLDSDRRIITLIFPRSISGEQE